jgi:fructokinase
MILSIGEFLIDVFPGFKRIGGAPFNFSYHLKKLGHETRLLTRIGKDDEGDALLRHLERNGYDLSDVQIDPAHATGKVIVSVDQSGIPEFKILPDAAFDYIEASEDFLKRASSGPSLIYFGSLAQRTDTGAKTIEKLLRCRMPVTTAFCDINLRSDSYSVETIERSLVLADILKLNQDELEIIRDLLEIDLEVMELPGYLMDEFNIRLVALTRGAEGSVICLPGTCRSLTTVPKIKVVDSVGAGDAYSAILAIGYLMEWDVKDILKTATMFAAQICTISGAVPDSDEMYESYLEKIGGVRGE